MEHANLYDVRSRQSKGFTPGELRIYKSDLLLILLVAHNPLHIQWVMSEGYLELVAEEAKGKQSNAKKSKRARKRRE